MRTAIPALAACAPEEEPLRLALESAEIGTWDLDVPNRALAWSEQCKRLIGLRPDQPASYDLFLHSLHPDEREHIEKAINHSLDPHSRAEYNVEYRIIRFHDGAERWVNARGRAFFDTAGRPVRFIGTVLDITDRKHAEQERNRLAEELRRSNHELEQFAFIVAHQLQEPLRMVWGFLTLLSRRYSLKWESDAREFLGYSLDGARRMRLLIEDLLAYARIDGGMQTLRTVELDQVLEQCRQNLKLAVDESGAAIEIAPMPTVVADPIRLELVFQNLIANALKFRSTERPVVRVSAESQERRWLFKVADNGIGIEMEFRDAIFNLFRRLHGPNEYTGNGIGLAICRKIIESHGGEIWVDSSPGVGSVFYFTLPKRKAKEMPVAKAS